MVIVRITPSRPGTTLWVMPFRGCSGAGCAVDRLGGRGARARQVGRERPLPSWLSTGSRRRSPSGRCVDLTSRTGAVPRTRSRLKPGEGHHELHLAAVEQGVGLACIHRADDAEILAVLHRGHVGACRRAGVGHHHRGGRMPGSELMAKARQQLLRSASSRSCRRSTGRGAAG